MLKRILCGALVASMFACGSDIAVEFFPQIDYTIAGQNKNDHEFFPDTTGGQQPQHVNILIVNSGKGDLTITDIAWKSQNAFLSMNYPSLQPSFPLTLKENGSLQLTVDFKPDPNIEDNRGGRIEISHSDKDKTENPIVMTFTIRESGCKIELDTTKYTYVNPSKHNPPEACFKFGNVGTAECEFKDAYMGTATPYYTVTKVPNKGTKIPALGTGKNPKNNPMKLEACVRLTPESPDKDYTSSLVIETSDKTNSKRKIALGVKWEAANVFKYTSDHPTGDLIYDFSGVTVGTKTRCLNVYNEGPAGYLVNTVEVVAYKDTDQSAAEEQYTPELFKLNTVTGEQDAIKTPFSVNAGKTLDICITFKYPNDQSDPVKARVLVTYSQANIPDKVEFPIVAGKCDTPQALFAPAKTPLWMMAAVGGSAKSTLLVANQSCAPLTIIKACVTQTTGVGVKDICGAANLASAHFKIASNVGLTTVEPWSIKPIEIEFAPPNEKYKNVHHLINVLYCSGPFSGNECKGDGAVTRALNITGHVAADTKVPTLKLAIAEGNTTVVGAPIKIEAIAEEGQFPISQYGAYLWQLRKRPKGSKVWLTAEFQVTDEAWLTIKPDAEGDYELIGTVQSVDPQTPSNIAWSEQVALTIKVTAK